MAGRLEGVHVLVVDDDPDILAGISLALRMEGAITETAADGAAAIRAVVQNCPDLVVLDVMLPAASGFVVLEKIRGLEDAPPVIMVTANQGRRHQTYAQGLGASAYFYKPVPLTRLIDRAVLLVEEDEASAEAEGDDPVDPDLATGVEPPSAGPAKSAPTASDAKKPAARPRSRRAPGK